MYEAFKRVLKSIIPAARFKQYEGAMRKGLLLYYKGHRHVCNICGVQLRTFIVLKNGEKICPACGASARNRRVLALIQTLPNLPVGARILEFSPNHGLMKKLRELYGANYVTTDYAGEFTADKKLDITAIDEPNESYELIICFHVLEHITEDQQAMKELFRILKKGGRVLIQTPFREGKIYENTSIITPEERLTHFGQEDHVRIYSIEGLRGRLESAGFNVDVLCFKEATDNLNGFLEKETVLLATKPAH